MQYYSKSRKSPFVFRYFWGPFGIVDAYLTPLNGPLYGVSTGRCLFVIFPLRSLLASQREPRGKSDPGKKGQTHAQRALSPSRPSTYAQHAIIKATLRSCAENESNLLKENSRRFKGWFVVVIVVARFISHRENLSRATTDCTDAHMQHDFRSCPFSIFSLNTPGAWNHQH